MGDSSIDYVENSYLQWDTYKHGFLNVIDTIQTLKTMGLLCTQRSQLSSESKPVTA